MNIKVKATSVLLLFCFLSLACSFGFFFSSEDQGVLDGPLKELEPEVIAKYDACRNQRATDSWENLNPNIKKALLSKIHDEKSLISGTKFWKNVCFNNFKAISQELKTNSTKVNNT